MRDPDKDNNRWSVHEELDKLFTIALQRTYPDEDPYILTIKNKEYGDYYIENVTTICLTKPPKPMLLKDTAQAVMNNLPSNDMIEDCLIQSIGFLTIRLSTIWIAKSVHKMLHEGIETWAPKLPMKSAIVNMSSRNVAEELDVGHLRPTIIGVTLARMLDFSNVHVELTNHFGDRMQFGMLIEFLIESLNKGQIIREFGVFYKESKKRFDEDAEFRERAHQAQLSLQIGVKDCLDAWLHIRNGDQICYKTIFRRLGIHVEQLGDYFYYPLNQKTLKLLRQEKGLIEESEGDDVIFVEEKQTIRHDIFERKKKPLTVVKKNGYYENALVDLTALRHGLSEAKAEWIVYVADVGRKEYIEMCFTAARRAGWLPTDEDEYPSTKFVGYGLVDVLNRSGKLVDLLDDAKTRCKAALLERDKADELTAEELENTAETLGYGAVKYELLKDLRVFKYTLNVDEMFNDEGNTGVYLLYTHAQICSIINKSGKDIEELKKTRELILEKNEERELGLHFLQFTEVLEVSCTTVLPSILCTYLYELSKKFSSFYTVVCRAVRGADEEANILLVCEATRVIMTKCFHLLGITPIDKISMTIPTPVDVDDDVVMELFSSDEDKNETVSSSSSGEEKTPAKRFKSSDPILEEEIKMTPSLEPIKSSDFTLEEEKKDPNSRFQLFSANVHVDIYENDCKPCFLFGSITVSDNSVSSKENGWVPLYDPDYGYTDLFFRDWSEPVPIVNDGYINTLAHPRTHRSIPFTDFLHIRAGLYVLSKDDKMLFQVGKTYTCLGLLNITYDKFSTHILHGPDGFVELVYIVLKDAVDAAVEMTLITHPDDYDIFEQPLSVKIFAYYHRAGYDYVPVHLKKDFYYITLLDDSVTMSDKTKIPLNTSVLAVPTDGSLVIDVLIKDTNGNVIAKKIFDIPTERKGSSSCSSIDPVEGVGCSFKLDVNWI